MKVAITPLRASVGGIADAATATVDYVCGPRSTRTQAVGRSQASPVPYYADQTLEGPGLWLGTGAPRLGLTGKVETPELELLLRGQHPRTGQHLAATQGSTGRTHPQPERDVAWEQASYTFAEAARLLGVDASQLRRIAGRTRALLNQTGGNLTTLSAIEADGTKYLLAEQGPDGKWRVSRSELRRYHSQRRPANVVLGFDITFSAPKSVSLLWAAGDAPTRAHVTASVQRAVRAGLDYLETQSSYAGRGTDRVRGHGLTGAGFTHATSRNLDPQLHTHVIVANLLETITGTHRALDASALFAHAKTAGYLAGATLQHELSRRLGVRWRHLRSGIAEVDGIPRAAIEALSSRRRDIDAIADQLGVSSTTGRQAIAKRSRSAKRTHDLDALRRHWTETLARHGLDGPALQQSLGHSTPQPLNEDEQRRLYRSLAHPNGLTANSSTFDRRDAIQGVADRMVGRLPASGVEELANCFLTEPTVVTLHLKAKQTGPKGPSLRPTHGARLDVGPRYTTRGILRAETNILDRFRRGLRAQIGVASAETVTQAIEATPILSSDQREAIRKLCHSGHQIQGLVGPAGTGKTFALRVATEAWRAAGYQVVGSAVQGTAAENLQRATGIPSHTVAALLARADRATPDHPVVDHRTILVIDEASTIGTRDLSRLATITGDAGTKLVLAGDPAQHTSVPAGGAFTSLLNARPATHAQLHTAHRQTGTALERMTPALDELRDQRTDAAIHRLVVADQIDARPNLEDAYDTLARDWYQDRLRLRHENPRATNCMIAERHMDRLELNRRARSLLSAAGELHGPTVIVEDHVFQAGDEVICRRPAHDLYPEGKPDRYLRNGTPGRIISIEHDRQLESLVNIDFDNRGPVQVPASALRERPNLLTHSYALTSHAAQGGTYDAARILTTDRTSRTSLYVSASRARQSLRIYVSPTTRHQAASEPANPASPIAELARSVRKTQSDSLAIDLDRSLTNPGK